MMEGEYNLPMRFDDSRISSVPTAAGQNIGEWGYGVAVYGTYVYKAKGSGVTYLVVIVAKLGIIGPRGPTGPPCLLPVST